MIKIISKESCPFCILAKTLITNLGFKYEEIDVTNNPEKLREIVGITGMMTVPQIFNGEISKESLLGGYSDIEKLNEEGKLIELLK